MLAAPETAPLREGFTTGSAAAAAAKASVLLLHDIRLTSLDIPRPDSLGRLRVPLRDCGRVRRAGGHEEAWAEVVKDGGDDPDATHGAVVRARVLLQPATMPLSETASVRIEGGCGVGRVTLPGLPVLPGMAAINPAPRRQIALAVAEALFLAHSSCRSVDVLIEMPAGFAIACKTMNARLGILGGVSILGTAGIVRPFSHDAWRATVTSGCAVAKAMGFSALGLCTGRRSERLLREHCPDLLEHACVQMADLFAHALQQAAAHGFERICIACYGGKLVKMAQGFSHTHASRGRLDFVDLAARLEALGLPPDAVREAAGAVTARHVFEVAKKHSLQHALARELAHKALDQARRHAGDGPMLELFAFAHDDSLMISCSQPGRPVHFRESSHAAF